MSSSDAPKRPRPGPWPPAPADSSMASSWAKRTGFKSRLSGETNVSRGDSGQIVQAKPQGPEVQPDLEAGKTRSSTSTVNGVNEGGDRIKKSTPANGQNAQARVDVHPKSSREPEADASFQSQDDDGFVQRPNAHMKYELRDTPGLVPIVFYGIQHFVSMLGSLVLIPLVIVPAMGGTDEDTAMVVSTVLFMTGVTTLLHTNFGSRLPLIQGSSFVYLAPALAIINSPEFMRLKGDSFKHIMKELQGAIIISSTFQALLGYSGLMSIFLRLINPVVVTPTVAAVGLSFFSYGFPQVGTCLEIGLPQILLLVIFSLYLRKISVFGHRIFQIYAVPLGLGIAWAYAFLLTEAGAYSYKGCDINVPASNTVSDACRKHISTMKNCRVDLSHAFKTSPWFRFPYPLQWGTPVFHWKMALVMCIASIIASVDSVGSYHASSLLVASKPPTPGVVSRGIGLEGLTSVLAGIWGTGTGSTTLTENVHTIAVTRMGSRRSVELGACVLIVLSLVGKVGGFIASIPHVIVAGLLCFMWVMLVALGLSNLRYSEAGSSRNVIIVGLSLFLSLSVPAYFQQYGVVPNANSAVPSYFQPYIVASHGPFRSKNDGVSYVLNTLLSLHMVIAFLVAFILDNTVPGSRQERGVYVWSRAKTARREPDMVKDYGLPFRVGRAFAWVKWVGL
ncbi:nucleobase-ascorbate transporter 12 isoform X1 [Amborella trichopoda]|uniref:Nucleobase-ascorbate transporter 12 n=1 Tax=Amborella trichopoda TaxID=13333 RepID=W1PYP2_AMBTC|nr:nucleobase-ascorbate transporter 12 isoform X1 [Amborella trichopoda]ERN13189.1 hypothetical protein AMTR_s00040p00216710 [Amborella trichopoda]|eukprot:XP_006851722.1 nucleobase-ascorbate transporter 12 isoform X1 [Amborella trichopoda]